MGSNHWILMLREIRIYHENDFPYASRSYSNHDKIDGLL